MEETSNSLKISETAAKEKEIVSPSLLHRYYQNVMENTELSSVKVERAAKFLLLPEISELVGDHTKAMFLLSKGLTHDEVSEAFKYYYKKQKAQLVPGVPELMLHDVSQTESNPRNAVQVKYTNDTQRGLSLFLNLCQRVMVLAGISTAFYYVYQKWRTDRARENKMKKEQKRIEEELNLIKSELQKITAELKLQQVNGKTNANVLAEINSLKAILVSRQYFEEKQNTKLSIPTWQLKVTPGTSNSTDNINVTCVSTKETNTPSINGESDSPETSSNDTESKEPVETNIANGDIKQEVQINGESEEKIPNGDSVSESSHKIKKASNKNKNSKSKIIENGNNKKSHGVSVRID